MKKRFLLTILTLILSVALIFYFPVPNAVAVSSCGFDDYDCHYMINGVGSWGSYNRFYWMNSLARSYYSDIVDAAVTSWNFAPAEWDYHTSISLLPTTVQDNAMFEVWLDDYQSTLGGSPGYTELYRPNSTLINNGVRPSQNWTWARILLNGTVFSHASANKQATIAHEFGHAMGLDHGWDLSGYAYDINRIMCPSNSGRLVSIPQKADFDVINHLYP